MQNSRDKLKASCKKIGTVWNIAFVIMIIAIAASLIFCIYVSTKPESDFMIDEHDSGTSYRITVKLENNAYVSLTSDEVNENAVNHPKAVYVISVGAKISYLLIIFFIVYYIRKVFRSLEREDSPFTQTSVSALKGIGICVILLFIIPRLVLIIPLGIAGLWSTFVYTSLTPVIYVLLGGTFFSIAKIFSYGSDLQTESDETL